MKKNWTYKKLGEVCEIYQPKTISTEMLCSDGEFLVYGANGVIGRYNQYNHEESEVLMTCRGATCGTINISEPHSWINGNAMVIHPKTNDTFHSRTFLVYLLRSLDLSTIITGCAQPQITRMSLAPLTIPVPPLATQSRIVSELDLLQSIMDKQKGQLKEYDTLAQSIFYDMFGDPVENEKGWEVKKLGDCCNSELGKTLNQSKDTGTLRPYLCAINIQWNKIIKENLKQTQFEDTELERYSVKKGDLLICEGGDIGRAAIWNEDEEIQYQNALHRLRFGKEMIPIFCLYHMKYLKDKGVLDNRYGKGVTIKHLVKSALLSIPFILPPLSLQQSFASKTEAIERQKELINQSIREAQTLFDSRMEYYFGE